MTAAKAWPELIPKTATVTAMANSKLFDAAVKLKVVDCYLQRQEKGDEKHDDKINTQGDCNPDSITGKLNDVFTLKREHNQRLSNPFFDLFYLRDLSSYLHYSIYYQGRRSQHAVVSDGLDVFDHDNL
jgi:hypothetical protein